MAGKNTRRWRTQRARASGHARINMVAGDQYVLAPSRGPEPQASVALPAAPTQLFGRHAQLQQVLTLLDPAEQRSSAITVTAVSGLAGVGKTALALYAAHEAVARGWFTGGVLFVPLAGAEQDGAVGADQALGAVLRALGVRDDDLPPTFDEQAALYRCELARRAERGERLLVVADDAAGVAQVRHLVPGSPLHRLLVTSRRSLISPTFPARLIDLAELAPDQAADFMAHALAQAREHDLRPGSERAALAEVAAHCGHLPLALHIAAALLISDPGLPVATLAADLSDMRTRLAVLSCETGGGHSLAVRPAFDLSYSLLRPDQRLAFRLFSVNPGPDLATEGFAALAGVTERDARDVLSALTRAGLMREQPIGSGRWRMHDLIRLYADELSTAQAGTDGREDALDRLLTHYLSATRSASDHLGVPCGEEGAPGSSEKTAHLAWFVDERFNLVSSTRLAAETGRAGLAVALALGLVRFLVEHGYFDDALAAGHHAVAAARKFDDRNLEMTAWGTLGEILQHARRFGAAVDAYKNCLALARELADRHHQTRALLGLGNALRGKGRYTKAVEAFGQGLALSRETEQRHLEAATLCDLGAALRSLRRFDEAIEACEQSIEVFRDLGDRGGEGSALVVLGGALTEVRQFGRAVDVGREAVAIARALGRRSSEAAALASTSWALCEERRFAEAVDACRQSLSVFRDLGDRHREGLALMELAIALQGTRRFDEAIEALRECVDLHGELEDMEAQADALLNLGSALTRAKRYEEAIAVSRRGLVIQAERGDRHREGSALYNLSLLYRVTRRYGEAMSACQRSAAIFRELGDRRSESRVLVNQAVVLLRTRRFMEAVDVRRQAALLSRELGDVDARSRAANRLLAMEERVKDRSRRPLR
ncbi:tetratricopeptide repeat protein [Streptomyces sp. NRRL F-4474]|uniref:tetratricopeptide repeat protein n=1 Tax=Streptomyces sp. NRRL F-4474 TaxID=1463851 RepID=UPI00131AE66F|nr:tetratricopeptide repeat protein [Streptomyces sp. NRRL F-4474]